MRAERERRKKPSGRSCLPAARCLWEAFPYTNCERKRKVLSSAVFGDTYHFNFKNVVQKSLYTRLMVLFYPLVENEKVNYKVKCDMQWERDHQY